MPTESLRDGLRFRFGRSITFSIVNGFDFPGLIANILEADAEALVNIVNCVAVMGKGLALQLKQAFPPNVKAYESACHAGEVVPGKMFIFDNGRLIKRRYIINFPTKRHWRDKSRVDDIQSGLRELIEDVCRLGIRSIAVPPLGCALGGLNWRDVRPMIENSFSELPEVRVLLFPPIGAPDAEIEGGLNIG